MQSWRPSGPGSDRAPPGEVVQEEKTGLHPLTLEGADRTVQVVEKKLGLRPLTRKGADRTVQVVVKNLGSAR